jgi:hypothetical protein
MWSRCAAPRRRDMATPALLGVDVGFSATAKTTGLAWKIGDEIQCCRVGSDRHERRQALPKDALFSLIAFDAPIVPSTGASFARGCESVFYRGPFWNRCRPGLSHHGRGLALREAGRQAVDDFRSALLDGHWQLGPYVHEKLPMVEAFPNTFLGVLLPVPAFLEMPKTKTKKRSDWLYEQVAAAGLFEKLIERLGWRQESTLPKFVDNRDHDERAALICLLTAGFAYQGGATVVGDQLGGWFWLPPLDLWDEWATRGLTDALPKATRRGFPDVAVWDALSASQQAATSPADQSLAAINGEPMIKQRKNAKDRKRVVVIPIDPKQLKTIRAGLKKLPALDFRQLLDQARNSDNKMNLDDSFRTTVSKATDGQLVAIFETLGIDQVDPNRFMKGFVMLSMALLGVGVVTYEPVVSRPVRWVQRDNEVLYILVKHFTAQGFSVSQAIKKIASDPEFDNWFPYNKQSGRRDPKLTEKKQKEGAFRARWYALDKSALEKREAKMGPFLTTEIFGSESRYQSLLTTLDIEPAEKDRKKPA